MKSIKDFDVKYVLSPFEEEKVLSGAVGCNCRVYDYYYPVVAGTLYVDGMEMPFHFWQDGDTCIEGLW